jgi:uncharacterized protein CbrC (UPF0167 family)
LGSRIKRVGIGGEADRQHGLARRRTRDACRQVDTWLCEGAGHWPASGARMAQVPCKLERMETLPTFPLFRDPVGEGVIERGDQECAACRRKRGWVYIGPGFEGAGAVGKRVCPWCIADGTAASKLRYRFNEGIEATYVPPARRSAWLAELALVEERTPGFHTQQGNHWMACCGRACVYLGAAGKGDLEEGGKWAAAAASVLEFVDDEEYRANVLQDVGGISVGAYVFECVVCKRLRGYWDQD